MLCILSYIHRTTESVSLHLLGAKSLQLVSVPDAHGRPMDLSYAYCMAKHNNIQL